MLVKQISFYSMHQYLSKCIDKRGYQMSNMTKLSRSIAIALLSTVAAYSYAADTNIDEKLKKFYPYYREKGDFLV